ncbi:hypothetical protein [Chitinophaga sp. MM2321]|uniref:hypothetical protein n=1 Tax=Chitinophaga sp. MM2321 TaxID=3137178 RepID=UPI0032D57C6F
MKIDPNHPAYPSIESINHGNGAIEIRTNDFGLSVRAELVSRAMQGLIASLGRHNLTAADDIAHDAVIYADALITALNAEQ